ncbi:MoxR family ATPase [bacterium]|nr:MoxR family ATPase [bacterium]
MNSENETQQANPSDELSSYLRQIKLVKKEIEKVLIGQDRIVIEVLIALLSAGHVLIEGVPGLGKTLLVKALSRSINAQFSRIQFTPDLMPSDITGHAVFDMKKEAFKIMKGPVFTNFLLADEVNRSPAKTQAALLEVMQEKQVTIEGQAYAVGTPFMVLATQNPIEQEGTYPLPEAELDRFLLKLRIDYPSLSDEIQLSKQVTTGITNDVLSVSDINTIISPEEIQKIQEIVSNIPVDDQVIDYAVRIVRATREWPGIDHGAGPRGSIALIRAARAHAFLEGREFVLPDDVKAVGLPALRHRIIHSAEIEIEGISSDETISQIFNKTNAPRK